MNLNWLNLNRVNQWLTGQQLRLLDEAYQGAKAIKILEDQYFNGSKIAYTPEQSRTVFDYVKSRRDRQLLRIRANLAQFKVGTFLIGQSNVDGVHSNWSNEQTNGQAQSSDEGLSAIDTEVLEKLNFIDSVIAKYRESPDDGIALLHHDLIAPVPISHSDSVSASSTSTSKDVVTKTTDPPVVAASHDQRGDRMGFFRGGFSIRLRNAFDPNYEQRVVQELRQRRKQDKIALRWLMILLLVPVLVQMFAKNLVFEPMLGSYSDKHPTKVELSRELQEELLFEFSAYKEGIEIRELLGLLPEMTEVEKQEQLQEIAVELWRESREHALNGFKNILSDGVAIAVFAGLVYFNRHKLASLRNVSNRTFLGLSDPAKVFLFILITDMFVGFHSAEGWEVLLEGVSHHFGLPESKVFINGFIATVPVVIDSCIKFWIFSYLTRFSPSASAIYERMNT